MFSIYVNKFLGRNDEQLGWCPKMSQMLMPGSIKDSVSITMLLHCINTYHKQISACFLRFLAVLNRFKKETQNIFSSQKEPQKWQVLSPFFLPPFFNVSKPPQVNDGKKPTMRFNEINCSVNIKPVQPWGGYVTRSRKEVPNEEPMGKPTENPFFFRGYNILLRDLD